jgi:hypothetical protein
MRRSAQCWTWLTLALAAACSDGATGPAPAASFTPVVSNPMIGSGEAPAAAVSANVSATVPVAFVSLAPGAMPDGNTGTIRDLRSGASLAITLVDGGFDPVAIPATAGDTLEITIALSAGGLAFAKAVVPIRQPPRVVRTSPAKGRTDVAINASVAVVFSEPVEPATLDTASIHLLAAGVPVGGSIRSLDGSSMGFTFVPATPLEPATAYQLVLNDRITDWTGDHLEGTTEFGFTTAATGPLGGSSPWRARPPAPTDRYNAATAVVDGVLYVIGGADEMTGVVGTVEAYDPAADVWRTLAPMPTRREGLALGVVNGIIYAVGGANNGLGWSTLATVEAYDPATDTWTARASMPTARRGLGVGVVGGALYAIGGEAGGFGTIQVLGTVEAYDPATNTWVRRAAMPTARADLGVAVVNGRIYAAGGRRSAGQSNALATMEVYEPDGNTWGVGTPMAVARSRPALGVVASLLYAVGGFSGDGASTLASGEVYDVVTNRWQSGAQLPAPEGWWNGTATVNGVLYAVTTGGMLSYQP